MRSNNAGRAVLPMLLPVVLSGCLQTLQAPSATPATGHTPIAQEKPVAAFERPQTPLHKAPQPEAQVAVNPAPAATPKSQKTAFSKGKEISCTPDVVRPGDTLVIKTNKPYRDLGVRVPDKNIKFIFLVSDGYPEGLTDSAKFSKQMGIEINVAAAKIKPDTSVFTREGVYGFVTSTNLETDDGTPSYECKVRYVKK
jgi:hypothetical protein